MIAAMESAMVIWTPKGDAKRSWGVNTDSPFIVKSYHMLIKARLGRFRLYLTDKRMRVRQEREKMSKEDRDYFWHNIKGPLLEERGCCEMCGCSDRRKLQVHHILPYAEFPQLDGDFRNMMILCQDCHFKLHRNPFASGLMMVSKAKELNIDIKAVYGNLPYGKEK